MAWSLCLIDFVSLPPVGVGATSSVKPGPQCQRIGIGVLCDPVDIPAPYMPQYRISPNPSLGWVLRWCFVLLVLLDTSDYVLNDITERSHSTLIASPDMSQNAWP